MQTISKSNINVAIDEYQEFIKTIQDGNDPVDDIVKLASDEIDALNSIKSSISYINNQINNISKK